MIVSGVFNSCDASEMNWRSRREAAFETFEHRVEGVGQLADLVGTVRPAQALIELVGADLAHRHDEPVDRFERARGQRVRARGHGARGQHDHDREQRTHLRQGRVVDREALADLDNDSAARVEDLRADQDVAEFGHFLVGVEDRRGAGSSASARSARRPCSNSCPTGSRRGCPSPR
jgi:hypothetical protein